MNKIKTIMFKEWAEIFKNRMVLFTVAFMPLFFTALPLIILFAMRSEASMDDLTEEMPAQFSAFCTQGLSGGECFQVFMVSQFMIMFMILPLMIPATISAYSIVGEKSTRSLEPLLATPITTSELLIGKGLAAALPAIIATDAAFLLFALGAFIMIPNPALLKALLDGRWLIAIFIVGPLMALLAVAFSIMISSRVNDPRVAEQLSTLVILPVLLLFFGQISGLFILNKQLIILVGLILALVDVAMVYVAVRLFQREVILTRWK